MSLLKASHLGKCYKHRQVISNVSLAVSSGEIVGLLGPNGAGKTTCFYMIVGLITADEGQVFFDDQDITYIPMHARARLGVGYLPQEASIFRKLTVANNIKAILQTRKLSKDEIEQQLEGLLQEFNIYHLKDNMGISLSGGERRRVEIARAVAANPAFMLLDEPFAGVDPISIGDIKRIIKHLSHRGIGILITDHNVRETLDLCERAYIVGEGKVIAEGNSEAILSNQLVRDIYLGEEFEI